MSLTAQLTTLRAAILAETTPAFVTLRQANDEQGTADWYNGNGLDATPGTLTFEGSITAQNISDALRA